MEMLLLQPPAAYNLTIIKMIKLVKKKLIIPSNNVKLSKNVIIKRVNLLFHIQKYYILIYIMIFHDPQGLEWFSVMFGMMF